MKKLLTLKSVIAVLSVLLSINAYAYDVEIDGIYYDVVVKAKQATVVSGDNKYTGDVVIPETFDYDGVTFSVTTIEDGIFYQCTELSSVIIPNTVQSSIGRTAFSGCSNLISIVIGNSVPSIDEWAFENCYNLTSVVIGNSVTSIGLRAFQDCGNLISVDIPNSVTSIGGFAFNRCGNLRSVTIGNGVTSIGTDAFWACGVTSVNINDLVAWCNISFKSYASNPLVSAQHLYINGEEIKNMEIPNGVTSIKDYAFYRCSGLTSVIIPNSVTYIGKQAFYNCSGLTSVDMGNNVESIGFEAFEGCDGLTSINISNSVTSIGQRAFACCSGLTSVDMGNNVKSMDYGVFKECSNLTAVYITDLAAWCNISFSWDCSNPLEIAHHLYLNGEEVQNLDIPNSVSTIGSYSFYGCTGLISVTIPNTVTTIGTKSFSYCTGLTSVTIPNSITTIESNSFSGCIGLTSVEIPNSVNKIESSAFEGCKNIENVYCKAKSIPTMGDDVFKDAYIEYVTLHVPAASVENYRTTEPWSNFGTIVALGDEEEPSQGEDPISVIPDGEDMTDLLVNPDFSTNNWTGWTREAASGGNVAVGSYCAEAWNNSSFDIYQEVEDLPDGLYEISVQGFYRYGRGDNAYNAYLEQTVPYVKKGGAPVYVYMNNMSTPFVNVFDESEAEGFYSSDYYRSPNATYFPNGMSSSATAFGEGMYTQKAYGLVKEGEKMRVGVKGSSNQLNDSWVIFDNFKLTYRGKDATAAGEVLKMKSEELGDFLELYGESKMTTPVREAVEDVYNRSMNVLDPAMNYDMLMETNEALVVARENIQKVDEYMDARDAYESVCTLLEQYDTDHEEDIWNNINSLNEDADASVDLDTEELSELISRMEALTEIILQKVNEIQQRPIEMNDLYYGYDDETMTATVISGENKYTGDVVIPEFVEYNGATYTVTAIGDEAFVDCDGLTSVTIPNSVTCIGGYAFMNCLSLTSITIPETVDSIAAGAFNCSGLKSIIIPDGVTTIGHNTFSCCYGLKSVEIPNSVTSIGYAAFSFCSSMNSIAIPEGVIYIGDNAFFECSGLTDVYCLAYNVPETTDEEPFDGVDLDYVTLHVPASSIDEYMETEPWSNFGNIVGDAVLEWVELISNGDCETAPEHVFAVAKEVPVDGSNLHQARVVDGVGVDGSNGIEVRASDKLEYAWDNQFWIYEPYALPGGTRYIVEFDYKALRENAGYIPTEYHTTPSDWLAPGGIGSVYFTDEWQHFSYEGTVSTSGIRSIAFSLNDNNDANIYYFDNISFKVPADAIEDIEPIYVDDKYPVVDYDATGEDQYYFAEANGIRYLVNASKQVATVSSGGSYIGSVTIPASFVMDGETISVTEIGTFAFKECASLRSVNISEGVTRIKDHAFTGSTGLRLVTIPESVTSIGNNAFLNCTALKDVCCYAPSVPETDDYVFNGISLSDATLHVPETSIELYANDSQWGAFGNIVALTDEPIIYDDGSIAGIYYNFDAENMTAEVTSGDEEYVGDVVIPESVQYKGETYAVTAIGNEAFYDCYNLTSVTIPNSVTSIGEWAFVSCSGLSSMSIPASVTSIGECAFRYCVLSSIQVESGNPVYDSRDNCNAIIETASNTLIAGCENSFIPDGVTSIGGAAFSGSRGLTSITIPESVTSIGWTAFEDTGLSSVTIPNSVTTIGSYAFSGTPLTTVFIPKSVTSIGSGAFSGYGLTSIQLEEGNPVYDSRDNCNAIIETASNTLIEGWDFSTIPNSVTAIGEGAFVYCGRLTSIEIPNSVISIGSEAFWGCGLTSIIIPNSIKYIGGYAFYCPSLTDMYCYATKLPQTNWEIFTDVDMYNATLHVPAASLRAYSTTAPWSNFGNIVALGGGSSIIAGDANGDGNVNVFDVTATVNYILGSSVGAFVFDAADVNGDGTVNVFDVTKMVNIILGIDVVDDNESMQVVYQSDFKNFEEGSLPVGYSGEAQDSYRQSTSGNPLTGMAGAPRLMGSSTNANQGIYWGARSGSYGTLSFGKYYALGDYTDDDAVTDADALYLEPGEYFLNYRNASWDEAAGNMYMVGVYDADGMAVLEEYVTPTVTIALGPGSGTIPVSKYQFTVETPGYYYVEFWGSTNWNCWLLTSLSILKPESGTRANVRRAMADTTGTMLVENGNQEKNLVVDHAGQYVAMQFDVVVPTTQSVEDVTLNSMTDHVLSYQQVEPNRYRVIAFSMKNAGFEPTEDELVNISLSGVQKADIENAVFITTDGRCIDMTIVDEATGIETADADEDTDAIYTLSGVYMGTEIKNLPKGTYIRNQKKFIVK